MRLPHVLWPPQLMKISSTSFKTPSRMEPLDMSMVSLMLYHKYQNQSIYVHMFANALAAIALSPGPSLRS